MHILRQTETDTAYGVIYNKPLISQIAQIKLYPWHAEEQSKTVLQRGLWTA